MSSTSPAVARGDGEDEGGCRVEQLPSVVFDVGLSLRLGIGDGLSDKFNEVGVDCDTLWWDVGSGRCVALDVRPRNVIPVFQIENGKSL